MTVFMWLFDPKAMFPRESILKFQKIGCDHKKDDDGQLKQGQGWVDINFQNQKLRPFLPLDVLARTPPPPSFLTPVCSLSAARFTISEFLPFWRREAMV